MVIMLMVRPHGLFDGSAMRDALTNSMRASHVLALVLVVCDHRRRRRRDERYIHLGLATEALIFAGLALSVDILLGCCRPPLTWTGAVFSGLAPTPPR